MAREAEMILRVKDGDLFAALAEVNAFTDRMTITAGAGTTPALTVVRTDAGSPQEWWADGKRIAAITSFGLRIFAVDEHGQGDNPTDFLDIRNVPDEFGLFNESTAEDQNGTLINGDITMYTRWRIRPTLRDPHHSNGHFEIREDYTQAPGPVQLERKPFRWNHSRPGWGAGVWDNFVIRPDYAQMGDPGDGYRAIRLNLVADAPGTVEGIRHLLSLAIADDDRFVVDSEGGVTAAGPGEFAALTILGAPVATQAQVASAVGDHAADTTDVHGIPNTAELETTTGAQTRVDALRFHDGRPLVFKSVRPASARFVNVPVTDTTLYTCPTGKVAILSGLWVGNDYGASTSLYANIVPSGGVPGDGNLAIRNLTIAANIATPQNLSAMLTAGDFVNVRSGTAAPNLPHVVLRVWEIDATEATEAGLVKVVATIPNGSVNQIVYDAPADRIVVPFLYGVSWAVGWCVSQGGTNISAYNRIEGSKIAVVTTGTTGAGITETGVPAIGPGHALGFDNGGATPVNLFLMLQERPV